jgi:predicted transposase/invertase (TIGR01784 family)
MSEITNPHDKFFKSSFSRLDVVQSFIEEVFPPQYRHKINLNSLKLSNTSFIDSELSEHLADLVYQAEYAGEPAMITLLFEHKSYQEDFPEGQLLRYMSNIWREEQKQKKGKKRKNSTVVIPIIIHHGKSAWKKVSMRTQFGNPHQDLLKFLPEFDYLLFSLNDFSDSQIANFKNTFLSTAAMLLKHSRDEKEKFLKLEAFLIEKIKVLDLAHENDFITTIVYYLETVSNLTANEIIIIFTKVSKNVNNIAMTAYEEIKQETTLNILKGLVQNGVIQNGVSMDLIAKSFGLSIQKMEEMITKLKNSNT